MSNFRSFFKPFVLFCVFSAAAALAQGTQTATMIGTVYDGNGDALPGATVILESDAMQGSRTVVTSDQGRFVASLLPPGNYKITVTMTGFGTQISETYLGVGKTTPIKFTLRPEGIEEALVVTADVPVMDPSDTTTMSNFGKDAVDVLPVSRNPILVAELTPGTTTRNPTGNISIHGSNGTGNQMLVDGSEYSDNVYNSFRSSLLLSEAVLETQVLTSAVSAEYGRFEGGVVNVITKTGSNTFEGALRYEFTNPAWAASTPLVADAPSKTNSNPQFTFGGPIIKDRLWFFVGYLDTEVADNRTFTDYNTRDMDGNLLPIENRTYTYNYQSTTERYQAKLTFSPVSGHTITANYVDNANDQNLRAYVNPGEPSALVPQTNPSDVWKINYSGLITDTLMITANYGEKHQNLTAGGDPNGPNPVFTFDYSGYFNGYGYTGSYNVFENGWFSAGDGGDNRDNTTALVKLSKFLETGAGFHDIDVGFDYYEGKQKAANHQSPTLAVYDAYGRRINDSGQAEYWFYPGWNSIWLYSSARTGYASSTQWSFFVNDRWSINERLTVNLGLRYDDYSAEDELGAESAGSDIISPRLSVNYDLTGDGKFYGAASYSVYSGKLLETITNEVTAQGNPSEVDYVYVGDPGWFTLDEIQAFEDTAYDYSPDGIVYFRDPLVGTTLDPDLEPQSSDEWTVSFRWSINNTDHLSVTYVNRKWDGFYDTFQNINDFVYDDAGQLFYTRHYALNKDLVRDYDALEIVGSYRGKDGWMANLDLGFNATLSSMEGNHEGEGASVPVGTNGILGNFEDQWAAEGYDVNRDLSPYGALYGDTPLQLNSWGSYSFDLGAAGMLQTSLYFKYASGETYNDTIGFQTPQSLRDLNVDRTTTYYVFNERGTGRYKPFRTLDLGLRYSVPIYKKLEFFAEANVYNTTNYRGVRYWEASWNVDDAGNYVRSEDYYSPTQYYRGRSYDLAGGFRF